MLNIDRDQLRREVYETLEITNRAIAVLRTEAAKMGINVVDLRTSDGRWPMHDLVAAKTRATHSLVLLEAIERGIHAPR